MKAAQRLSQRLAVQATKRPSCLFLSPLWPEPNSSAAGVRTLGLVAAFHRWGFAVDYGAGAKPGAHSAALAATGVGIHHCGANREAALAAVLADSQPDVVVFDRFTAEEAFSFRVKQLMPGALRVLDMQDMHSLRRARHALVQAAGTCDVDIAAVAAHTPDATSESLLRELAAIHRSDLTLVCSPMEMELLACKYSVPRSKLALAPFFCDTGLHATQELPPLVERQGYVTIGGFRHAPNVDGVVWLAKHVWPLIRDAQPEAVMHVYGAYPTQAIQQLHNPGAGFLVRGAAPSLDVLAKHRVLLAPLRFGAGIKGKIVDAWQYGLPVATTPIGCEGMVPAHNDSLPGTGVGGVSDWGGSVAATAADLARDAVHLHDDAEAWHRASNRGRALLRQLFDRDETLAAVQSAVDAARRNLAQQRHADFVGAMLWHHTARSTEYFSRWIELKETAASSA